MGQLCVAKEFRGLGIAQQLYIHFKKAYKNRYAFAITDVDQKNNASLAMHLKVGFKALSTLNYGKSKWDVVVWDWKILKNNLSVRGCFSVQKSFLIRNYFNIRRHG